MKCSNCGVAVNGSILYCPDCGAKVESASRTVPLVVEYTATSLSLDVLFADIKISFSPGNSIVIKIDGDEEMKKAVDLTLIGGKLSIEGKLPGVEVDRHSIRISLLNDIVVVNNKRLDISKKLKVDIVLPMDSEISLGEYVVGSIIFTNNGGNVVLRSKTISSVLAQSFDQLNANCSGLGNLNISDVLVGLTLHLSGLCNFAAGSVKGASSLTVLGSGSVNISDIIGTFTASVQGMGDINAHKASLESADVTLRGSGNVEIKAGDIKSLSVKTEGMGDFVFGGHAETGSFQASGMGDIEVSSCSNILKKKETGMGDITIG